MNKTCDTCKNFGICWIRQKMSFAIQNVLNEFKEPSLLQTEIKQVIGRNCHRYEFDHEENSK